MNKAQPFRQHHITRALRAAAAAGAPNPTCTIRCSDGTVFTISSKPDDAAIPPPKKTPSRKSAR